MFQVSNGGQLLRFGKVSLGVNRINDPVNGVADHNCQCIVEVFGGRRAHCETSKQRRKFWQIVGFAGIDRRM